MVMLVYLRRVRKLSYWFQLEGSKRAGLLGVHIQIRTRPELNFAPVPEPVPEPPVQPVPVPELVPVPGSVTSTGTGTMFCHRYPNRYQALSPETVQVLDCDTGTGTVARACKMGVLNQELTY